MRNKKLTIGDTEVKQNAFLKSKNPIEINEVDIDKIVISDKASYGKKDLKYFIGYKDGNKIKSLCIKTLTSTFVCFVNDIAKV